MIAYNWEDDKKVTINSNMEMEMIFSHGIDYCSNFSLLYKLAIRRTIALAEGKFPEWTLSCSRKDQPLGTIGFYCTGNVVDMFDRDCFSIKQEDGSRKPSPEYEQYRCTVDEWYKSTHKTEAFVNNIQIKCFWIKREAFQEYADKPLHIAEIQKLDSLGIPVKIID